MDPHGVILLRALILSALTAVLGTSVIAHAQAPTLAPGPELIAAEAANPWPPPPWRVSWSSPQPPPRRTVHLQLLGFNDFHGNLQSPAMS